MAATLLLRQGSSRRVLLSSSGAAAARIQAVLSPLPSTSRAASSWTESGSYGNKAGPNGAVLLFLAAAAAAATTPRPAEEAAAPQADHTLYVAGSASGRGLRETVVDVPKEVPVPGRPGPIDSVSFGPAWVAVAKEGAVHISTAMGAPDKNPALAPETFALHQAGGGWLGGSKPRIVQVACGNEVVYGRTASGQVLCWRRQRAAGKEGGPLRFDGPRQYPGLKRAKVTHIAAGPEHAVFVTADGEAYAVGNNVDGRLGTGELKKGKEAALLVAEPTRVQMPEEAKVVGASCGGTHTLLLDSKGGAYACGADAWYQLGLGETWKVTKDRADAIFPVPKKVRAFEEAEVTGLAAGGNHSLFAVAFPGHWVVEGRYGEKLKTPARVLEAWACGFGQWGALADRAYVHLSPPKRIRELRLMSHPDASIPPPILVACGENHSAALLFEPVFPKPANKDDLPPYALKGPALGPPPPKDHGVPYRPAVYVWGHNLGGQLGTGKAGNLARPVTPQVVDATLVDAVVCGYDYTGFVQRRRKE